MANLISRPSDLVGAQSGVEVIMRKRLQDEIGHLIARPVGRPLRSAPAGLRTLPFGFRLPRRNAIIRAASWASRERRFMISRKTGSVRGLSRDVGRLLWSLGLAAAVLLITSVAASVAFAYGWADYARDCRANGGTPYPNPARCIFNQAPPVPPSPPDPQVLAMQRVAPQYRALIAKLSDHTTDWGLLGRGWDALPVSTPDQLQAALQQLYDALYSSYLSDQREAAPYWYDIQARDHLRSHLADVAPKVELRKKSIDALRGQLQNLQAQANFYKRAENQLDWASENLETATASLQDETIGWIRATLPQTGVNAQAWGRWRPIFSADTPGPGERWAAPLLVEAGKTVALRPVPMAAAEALGAEIPAQKPPIPASIDDRMAAVNQMAVKAHDERVTAQYANNGGRQSVDAETDRLQSELGRDRDLQVNGDIIEHNLQVQITVAANTVSQLTIDDTIAAQRHVAAVLSNWIWQKIHDEAIKTIKEEVIRAALAEGTGRRIYQVDDAEVRDAIEHNRWNIFGLPDRVLEAQKIRDVVNDVGTLANHSMEYSQLVARAITTATPAQLEELLGSANQGLDHDVGELQRHSIKAAGLREPFGSAWLAILKYSGSGPTEQ